MKFSTQKYKYFKLNKLEMKFASLKYKYFNVYSWHQGL